MIYEFTEIEKMNYGKYFGKKMEKQFIPSTIRKILFHFNRKYCNILAECYNLVIYL